MTAPPSVGVVIPTHNRAESLRRAIESVPSDWELVVVDDASEDQTPELLDELGARAKTYRFAENRGPGVARNKGVALSTARRLVFLDDDDRLLPDGPARITWLAQAHPDVPLHLHNCVWSTGRSSLPVSDAVTPVDFHEWLGGSFMTELKPVVDRQVFDRYEFADTGASGEGLLWGLVIRDLGAIASAQPIVYYDVSANDRLTSVDGLLRRASQNAWIADRWLELFGADQRAYAPRQWRRRVIAAALYNALAGRRDRVRDLASVDGLSGPHHMLVELVRLTPNSALRAALRASSRIRHR